jgi:membrane-bound lytic murein transglycosylase D
VFAGLAVLVFLSSLGAHAAQERQIGTLFPLPESLKPSVDFWIRVFAKLEGGNGVLHDAEDLSIIYETLSNLPRDKKRRRSLIRRKHTYYQGVLERLARGKRGELTRDERRVLAMFEGRQTKAAFLKAAEQVRFQGGIREAFRAGLVRSGAYLPVIEPIFEAAGLPKALTLLPHVESSFRNDARSRSGAAGLWQFMPSTGRRFLRINRRVDERHDVERATLAASKLLKENYELLGTWPLAITAYNHGAWGMKRAVEQTGTKDIGKIVQRYRGRAFGFASRNFYAEFLAAVHVARNYERYFGPIRFAKPRMKPVRPQHYRVRRGDSLHRIARRFDTTVEALATLNDLEQLHLIQVGQLLHIPAEHDRYRVRRGDTLGKLARRFDTTVDTLVAMNDMVQTHFIKVGQVLRVPAGRVAAASADFDPIQPQRPQRYRVKPGDSLSVIAVRFNTTVATLAMLNGLSKPYLIKPGQVLDVAQPTPLGRYQVKRGDTLGRVARRFRTTVATLAALNGLRAPYLIKAGQTLVIPQLRSHHPDDSTVTGVRLTGEDTGAGFRVSA